MKKLVAIGALGLMASYIYAQGLNVPAGQTKDDWEEINFEFNSSILSDGYPSLLRLAEVLGEHHDYKVISAPDGRALATEHDFTADKVKDEETPVEDITEEYSQYVDPKYLEQTMQESLMIGVEDNQAAGRKGPSSETGEPAAAEASQN